MGAVGLLVLEGLIKFQRLATALAKTKNGLRNESRNPLLYLVGCLGSNDDLLIKSEAI